MATYTINSWCYYNVSTVIATGDQFWNKQTESVNSFNSGSLPASFSETTAVNNSLDPGESVDPDYSAQNATYLGTVTIGGRTFVVFEDEFGQLLGSPEAGLAYTDFPAAIDYPDGTVTPDPNDGLAANSTIICFLSGTLIETPAGARAVEALAIGDLVVAADGRSVPVKWIGRQTLNKFRHGAHRQPVRIRAGALGDGIPHADLTVTADHGMVMDGFVINASALVNGTTIDWVPSAELPDNFTVYHIETDAHDVILANGAPSETYIDYAGRRAFDNYQDYLDLYGAERIIPEMPAPRISARRHVPAEIRQRLGGDALDETALSA